MLTAGSSTSTTFTSNTPPAFRCRSSQQGATLLRVRRTCGGPGETLDASSGQELTAQITLVDALNEPLAQNVDHIEIWSGDHALTDIARQFTRNGIPVTVHARPHGIARSLEHVATRVHRLTELSFMHTTPILDGAA